MATKVQGPEQKEVVAWLCAMVDGDASTIEAASKILAKARSGLEELGFAIQYSEAGYGEELASAALDSVSAETVATAIQGVADSQPAFTQSSEYPKPAGGGGWYELSDGSKVQGKEAAEEAEAAL